jgi:hypothetical protein
MAKAAKKRKAINVPAKTAAKARSRPKPKPRSPPRRKTVTNKDKAHDAPVAPTATITIPPEDTLTEQEKAVVGTGGTDVTAGVGPTSPAEHTTGPVETIEDQGIGPRTPYPSADDTPPPPPPETRKKEPR